MGVGFKVLDTDDNYVPIEEIVSWREKQVSFPADVESVTGSKDGELAILIRVDKTKPGPRL